MSIEKENTPDQEQVTWDHVWRVLEVWPTQLDRGVWRNLCSHIPPATVLELIRDWQRNVTADAAGYRPKPSQIAALYANQQPRTHDKRDGMTWDTWAVNAIIALGDRDYTTGFFTALAAGDVTATPAVHREHATRITNASREAA